jgi:hypothetical protein
MKKLFTLSLFLFTFGFVNAQSPELLKFMTFENLQNVEQANYGSKTNPIQSGAFINVNDRSKMIKLKNSYRWPDGQPIDFSIRGSLQSSDGKGIIDCYTLVKPGTSDTIKLYVDPYKISDFYYVPKGLVAINLPLLKKEIAPYLKLVEELEADKDAINLKDQATKLLSYISSALGTSPFVDSGLTRFIDDKEIDPALKSFLFRSYLFNKFYAYGKGFENEKSYAWNKMKQTFQKYIALHPDAKIGNLKTYFAEN